MALAEVIGWMETGWGSETDRPKSQHHLHHSLAESLRQVTSPPAASISSSGQWENCREKTLCRVVVKDEENTGKAPGTQQALVKWGMAAVPLAPLPECRSLQNLRQTPGTLGSVWADCLLAEYSEHPHNFRDI